MSTDFRYDFDVSGYLSGCEMMRQTEQAINEIGDIASAAYALAETVTNTASGVPSGFIGMWSGAVDAVPEGWLLCDGENGTPDLRDRFIVGAGNSYAVGAAGGATTHNHGGVTGNTTITTATMPAHGHAITLGQLGNFNNSNGGRAWTSYTTTDNIRYTNTDAGSGGAHNHNISAVDNRPPYYALAYIMKL